MKIETKMTMPLRFRAWDGERMQEVVSINFSERYVMTPKGSGPLEDYKLMQDTGIKDKNGKEIWGGDIVETEFGYCVVSFSHGAVFIDGGALVNINLKEQPIEVIGNIYQNPELLK